MRAVAVGALVAGVGAVGRDAVGGKLARARSLARFGPDRALSPSIAISCARAAAGASPPRRGSRPSACRPPPRSPSRPSRSSASCRSRSPRCTIVGRAVEHAADALHRQFERVGGDLREHGLDALPDRRRADIDRDRAVASRARAGRSRAGPSRRLRDSSRCRCRDSGRRSAGPAAPPFSSSRIPRGSDRASLR